MMRSALWLSASEWFVISLFVSEGWPSSTAVLSAVSIATTGIVGIIVVAGVALEVVWTSNNLSCWDCITNSYPKCDDWCNVDIDHHFE